MVGAEVSYAAADGPIPGTRTTKSRSSGTDLLTATGRLGVAFDKFLIYGNGGFATTRVEVSALSPAGVTARVGQQTCWTAGGGLAVRLLNDVLFGVEYDYVNLPTDRYRPLQGIDPRDRPNLPFNVDICDLHTQVVAAA